LVLFQGFSLRRKNCRRILKGTETLLFVTPETAAHELENIRSPVLSSVHPTVSGGQDRRKFPPWAL
jgi:hypothetical protein